MPRRTRSRRFVGRVLDLLAPRAAARRAFPDPLPHPAPWARVDLAWGPAQREVLR
ncbi:hypothetical protein H5399_05285 [Tessaracoccus sp. MC1627]|uniref:hypothetical protein n=1 Tax=Tessaracoccus sp. MC1627 TaxID=2760312 RepID=UPI0016031F9F|nr:hypothetical protein [Tessaracoccus sp. MC1627]MBB1512018.1 hypothetical protein [Tessaracoccus sp. MC1627]